MKRFYYLWGSLTKDPHFAKLCQAFDTALQMKWQKMQQQPNLPCWRGKNNTKICCVIGCEGKASLRTDNASFTRSFCENHRHFILVRALRKVLTRSCIGENSIVPLPGSGLFDVFCNTQILMKGSSCDTEVFCDITRKNGHLPYLMLRLAPHNLSVEVDACSKYGLLDEFQKKRQTMEKGNRRQISKRPINRPYAPPHQRTMGRPREPQLVQVPARTNQSSTPPHLIAT